VSRTGLWLSWGTCRVSPPRGSSATCRTWASAGCTQIEEYDRERGISYWTKNYRTALEAGDPGALTRAYEYYDPIGMLPEEGQAWWRQHAGREPGEAMTAGYALAAVSRKAVAR